MKAVVLIPLISARQSELTACFLATVPFAHHTHTNTHTDTHMHTHPHAHAYTHTTHTHTTHAPTSKPRYGQARLQLCPQNQNP